MKRPHIELSEDLKWWRAERPDEWTMDRFIAKAEEYEAALDDLLKACKPYLQRKKMTQRLHCHQLNEAYDDAVKVMEGIK